MSSEIGDRLKRARKRNGKTQAQIAAEVGVTQPLVAKWEDGGGLPITDDLRKAARAYGLRPDQLIPPLAKTA